MKKKKLAKPRKKAPRKKSLPAPSPNELYQVRLGNILFKNQGDMVEHAHQVAQKLREIIVANAWFEVYEEKEHVKVEGWTMLGALIGVTAVEEYCKQIALLDEVEGEGGKVRGFEARMKLLCNGEVVGGASAECTLEEAFWAGKDTFALRSMTLTRATSKSFRLSYGWIMSLAKFEALPWDEIANPGKKIVLQPTPPKPKLSLATGAESRTNVFGVWPKVYEGGKFFLYGSALNGDDWKRLGLESHIQEKFKAVFTDKFNSPGWLIDGEQAAEVKKYLESHGHFTVQLPENPYAAS